MSEEKIVNNYYQTNIRTSRNENSGFTLEDYVRILNQYQELQQENQQLKEELKDENNYHNEAVKWYKEAFDREQEIIKYKSVLDEIKRYIDFVKSTIEHDKEYDINYDFLIRADKLVEILKKVKE